MNQNHAAVPIVALTNAPSPYRIPLFNAIDRRLREEGFALHIFFGAPRHLDRQWQVSLQHATFNYRFGTGRARQRLGREFAQSSYAGLASYLAQLKPALVLVDGFSPGATQVALLSRLRDWHYLIWSGAIGHEPGSRQWLRWLRTVQRRLLCQLADGAIAHGTLAARYLERLGMAGDRITVAFNAVDDRAFEPPQWPRPLRARDKPCTFVTVGTLNERKGLDRMLAAGARLAERTRHFRLCVVGDGALRSTLEAQARTLGIAELVTFTGHLEQAGVSCRLAAADAFVFPTLHDIWGLALNEAMLMGLPAIASVQAGATHDLIVHERNGFAVDFDDSAAVADAMARIAADPHFAQQLGAKAREVVLERAALETTAARCAVAIAATTAG